jgi:NAD(P)-dependent dehydrogenase (short-subunit alcohol dehydrogenase family)
MNSRIATPFGPESTAAEVLAQVDLSGRRAIVTGGASGIGAETARALAAAGAGVTIAVRNVTAGKEVAGQIAGDVHVASLDLADQASVAEFAEGWTGPLHILVNNAGIMAAPLQRTPQGWEMQFATNHLGHFALATGLHDALAAAGGARVVSVSSVGHLNGGIDFGDIHFQRKPYDPWLAYSQSKTANVLFAVGAAARWSADGIAVNALTPGRIRTNLMRFIGDEQNAAVPTSFEARSAEIGWKTVPQGAATSALLAGSPLLEGVSGRYFEDCQEAEPNQPGVRRGVAAYALEPAAADRLWQVSVDTLAGQAGAVSH